MTNQPAGAASICLGLALLLGACPASSPQPRSDPAHQAAQPAAAQPAAARPLDAPCNAAAECMAGLQCAPRPKGEFEDAAPAGPVCRGQACELGEGTCSAGSVCCPGLTGVYGPYCLANCRRQDKGHCARLLDNKDGICNTNMGCCHVPKVLKR